MSSDFSPVAIQMPAVLFLSKEDSLERQLSIRGYKDYLTSRRWRRNYKSGRLYWDDEGMI